MGLLPFLTPRYVFDSMSRIAHSFFVHMQVNCFKHLRSVSWEIRTGQISEAQTACQLALPYRSGTCRELTLCTI
jgi:hypothetical protein